MLVFPVTSAVWRAAQPSPRVAISDRVHVEASSAIASPETVRGPGSLHKPVNNNSIKTF